jgi:RNA polymerase sigma-54 factor
MALEQKLHLKLAQRLVMTPTLQQAIKLLQLSRLELEQTLAQEIQVNPILELIEDTTAEQEAAAAEAEPTAELGPGDDGAGADEAEPGADDMVAASAPVAPGGGEEASAPTTEEAPAEVAADAFAEVELDALFSNYLHDSPSSASTFEDSEEAPLENSPTPEASMFDALVAQLGLHEITPELRTVCDFVAGNLDPDGYLRVADIEIATQLGVPEPLVAEAIACIQRLDPPGIGARDLRECFLLQLDRLEWQHDGAPVELARRVVDEGLDDLLHQRWDRIVQRFGVSRDEIRSMLEVIRRLDPRPGVALGPSDNSVIEPDVVATKNGDQWRISLHDEGLPRLRLSSRYVRMLQSRGLDGETSGYLRERMRAALWFLRSVEQRQNTIVRVGDAIVRRQREFLERGLQYLKPLVLRDIADDIGMHESTISRVVANKFIATPRGVFPLKFFFHSAISHAVDGDISSVVVKERIKELIASEEPRRPLSDARVARQLNRLGIRIARRTVAKYREELGIPSSEQRRRTLR